MKNEIMKLKVKYRAYRTVLVLVLAVVLTLAIAVPLVSAKYVAQLNLLANTGVDGVTNRDLIDALWPVDSIYFTASPVNPGSAGGVFAGTTWVAWGEGQVPVGVDTGVPQFNTVEKTGGALGGGSTPVTVSLPAQTVTGTIPFTACSTTWTPGSYSTASASVTGNAVSLSSGTVTVGNTGNILTGAPSITNASVSLTAAQMPRHTHSQYAHSHSNTLWATYNTNTYGTNGSRWRADTGSGSRESWTNVGNAVVGTTLWGVSIANTTASNYYTGGSSGTEAASNGDSHTHVNTVGVGTLATSGHTHTASVGTATNHNAVGSHSVVWPTHTDPAFSHTPAAMGTPNLSVPAQSVDVTVTDNTLQPYITCYMWKRTS